ncbi:toxin-antitoxin system YwqK family antitoxin [Longibacter sp.]|uniref:toxin-antitoxin system YwqK family antitoxin n=1 Tax=Longibacter sp. TaxID=2045415 RepID=UPI003EB76A7E
MNIFPNTVSFIFLTCWIGVVPVQAQPTAAVLSSVTPSLPDTLRTDQIKEENGFTVVRSTGAPFTGTVADGYESWAKKLRRSVVDGLPEGLWMEWYENGVPRYQATWRRGRGEGLWTYYHENGEIRERVTVTGDVYDGLAEGWHASGAKAFEGHYRNGNKDGRWRRWDERGLLATVKVYRDGTVLHVEKV